MNWKTFNTIREFTFDPIEHVYTLDGKKMYGTTTVLGVINKPMLIQWAATMTSDYVRQNVSYVIPDEDGGYWAIRPSVVDEAKTAHRKKKEEAGALGTDVHAEIEEIINDWIDNNEGEAQVKSTENNQVSLFIDWACANKVKFLASEKRLYSETLWCAGTADFICDIGGKLCIGDIKTSSGVYPEHFIQASAYAKFAEEMELYKKFDGVVIVNLPKKGGINVKFNYDITGNFECFKACLTIKKQLEAINTKV